jgi:hypothetical protein
MSKQIRLWLHGLFAAAIGGGANALTALVVDPEHFTRHAWEYAGVGALLNAAFYLSKSPLWKQDDAPSP